MAGISDPPFRLLLREWFDGIAYTEMVSVEGIRRNNPQSTCYLDTLDSGPTVAQLFGGNPDSYPEAVDVAMEYKKPDAFDINMGCPVKKVVKTGGGSALLRDLPKIKEIVRAMRRNTEVPFSIKIRTGWDEATLVYKEIQDIAESEGADALILHARTRSQMFGGRINYDALAEIASRATIPVIGNGDVHDYESYRKIKETGVHGVMIGRAMMHAPWVFKAIRENKDPQGYLSAREKHAVILKLYGHMLDYANDDANKRLHYLNIIKKISVWFSKGLRDAAVFRAGVYKNTDETCYLDLLDRFFNNHE